MNSIDLKIQGAINFFGDLERFGARGQIIQILFFFLALCLVYMFLLTTYETIVKNKKNERE